MGAVELAREQVRVVADALAVLYVLAAAAQYGVSGVPELLADDGRDDLARLVLEHDPFLGREKLLLLREHVHYLDLVSDVVALVFGVGYHVRHGRVCDLLAVEVAVALVPKERLKLLHAVLVGGVELKELAYHRSLLLVDDKALVVLTVAEDAAVAEYHAGLYRLLMAEFHAARELPELVLRYRRHYREAQLAVLVERVDVVVLEEHAHSV